MTASDWFMVDGREFETVEDRAENYQGARHIECGGEFRTVGRDPIKPEDHVCTEQIPCGLCGLREAAAGSTACRSCAA